MIAAAVLLLALPLLTAGPARADDVLVFAAASLKNALDDAITAYGTSDHIRVSYAASSALAKQIGAGAPADIFISADRDWMDYVQKKNLIRVKTRRNLFGNELVIVAPQSSNVTVDVKPGFPLAKLLGDGRLSLADPDSVPAGKYAKAALQQLGIWSAVEDRLARAENARAALLLVSREEAPLGIVYATDAAADKGVKIVGVFPTDTHPPIVYPIALTAGSKDLAAAKFLKFLESAQAKPYFEKQGFTAVDAH